VAKFAISNGELYVSTLKMEAAQPPNVGFQPPYCKEQQSRKPRLLRIKNLIKIPESVLELTAGETSHWIHDPLHLESKGRVSAANQTLLPCVLSGRSKREHKAMQWLLLLNKLLPICRH